MPARIGAPGKPRLPVAGSAARSRRANDRSVTSLPAGTAMTNGGGTEVQGTDAGMIGPGGESVFTGGGSDWLVYHYYDAFDNGDAWIQVRPLTWVGGWPVTGQALVPVPGQRGLRPAEDTAL